MADDVDRLYSLKGPILELARTITASTGAPGRAADCPELRSALSGAFPALPSPRDLEGCTTHPALTLKLPVPGLGQEAVKVVLAPRRDALEARVRALLAGGSYRKETLTRVVAFLEEVERALDRPAAAGEAGPEAAGGGVP